MIDWKNIALGDIIYRLISTGIEELSFSGNVTNKTIRLSGTGYAKLYKVDDPLLTILPEEVADHFQNLVEKWREK